MRYLCFLLTLLLCLNCSDSDDSIHEQEPPYGYGNGGLEFSSKIEKYHTASDTTQEEDITCYVYIWKAENRTFNVSESGSDIIEGRAYDENSQDLIDYYIFKQDYFFVERLPIGKYFIYINTGNTIPKFAYSYRYFEVEEGELTTLEKVFPRGTMGFEDVPW